MLGSEWLIYQVETVHRHWKTRLPDGENLEEKCVQRVLEIIRQYREQEDPEQYRQIVRQYVQYAMASCEVEEAGDNVH